MAKILKFSKFFNRKNPVEAYKHRHFLNSLSKDKLREILLLSEAEHLVKLVPDLKGKRVLFLNDQKHKYVLNQIKTLEPTYLINQIYKTDGPAEAHPSFFTMISDVDHLAVRNLFFDVIICPFALEDDIVHNQMIAKLGKKLKNGGRLILSLPHPQLEQILYNQNPSQSGSPDHSLSQYFRILRENHLYTENVNEGCVDHALKPFFVLESEYDHFHEYRHFPVTLFFRTVKFFKQ